MTEAQILVSSAQQWLRRLARTWLRRGRNASTHAGIPSTNHTVSPVLENALVTINFQVLADYDADAHIMVLGYVTETGDAAPSVSPPNRRLSTSLS